MAGALDKRLLQRATATRGFLVAVAATGVLNAGCIIAQAWLIAHAVAGVFDSGRLDFDGPLPGFASYVLAIIAIFVLRGGLSWLNSWLAHRASAAVKSTLRTELMTARLVRPNDTSTSSSALIHLATQGLDALDGYFAKYLPQLVMAAFIPLLMLAVVLGQDWVSAAIIAVTLPLIPLFMIMIGRHTQAQVRRRYQVQTRLANHFADLITGLPALQVFGRARAQLRGLRLTEDASRTETMKTLRIAFLSGGVLELLATLSVALVAVSVGFRVVDFQLDLTTALFILILAPEAYIPVRAVGVHFHDSADGTAAAEAAFGIIENSERSPVGGHVAPGDLAGVEIEFDQVGVRYPGADRASLEDLSCTIRPGEVLALVRIPSALSPSAEASTWPNSTWTPGAASSLGWAKIRACCAAPSRPTCGSVSPLRPTPRCARAWTRPADRRSNWRDRSPTTARGCRPASDAGSRWRGRCCESSWVGHGCSCWTSRLRVSTRPPRRWRSPRYGPRGWVRSW